ncbi:hypothetical protein WKI71_19110 [Streptomyces sp. MS1.AVA.1]|uniref:Flp pilus assembly protein RcpC/CpaB domain-containing protein n=1 Tax=Streptomyces machairae TaxID=3134109 RepID=A0ABU8UNP3_9ACTN
MSVAPSSRSPFSRSPSSLSPFPAAPLPLGTDAPPAARCRTSPVRVRGGRYRLRHLVRQRRRAVAAGLAVTAAALVAAGPGEADRARGHPAPEPVRHHRAVERARAVETVSAPVRISDGATVRLLRPGDRIDVIAAQESVAGGDARVVARGVRVTEVPELLDAASESGALVVLSVPRSTAARLAGASATARLAVTLC